MVTRDDYLLRSVKTGKEFKDDGFILQSEKDSFLISEYNSRFRLENKVPRYAINHDGLSVDNIYFWKYRNWLPVDGNKGFISTTCDPIVMKSKLGESMGYPNTWFVFNGYWPEKGALYPTGTIKDLEAITVMQRSFDHGYKPLVVASDGNTGKAIAYLSARTGLKSFIVIPEDAQERMWIPGKLTDYDHLDAIKLIVLKEADYFNAIETAQALSKASGKIVSEGGAKNVGRRDGMGKALLAAALEIGQTPDNYFQAIGSGPGAIAAFEESRRLISSEPDTYTNRTRIHVAQNRSFAPVVNAWNRRSDKVEEVDLPSNWREMTGKHYANELTNRHPAYGIRGGLFDILKASEGRAYAVSEDEAIRAGELFQKYEGIDIVNPAKVTIGAFIRAARNNDISKEDITLINITGGGYDKLQKSRIDIPIAMMVDYSDHVVSDIIKRFNL